MLKVLQRTISAFNSSGMAVSTYKRDILHLYNPPEWTKSLINPPIYKMHLAQIPTPIHKWSLPGIPEGFEMSVKRDDLTGAALSGNKIRKLEFLMADVLHKNCDHVITMGGLQSNHARATAVISRQLGLQPHLLLRTTDMDPSIVECKGNLLLDRLMGSQIVLTPYRSAHEMVVDGKIVKGLTALMEEYAQVLRSKGNNPYIIPVGGSNVLGIWGYIEGFREMIEQGVLNQFDDIVMAVGSGGTVAGMAISNYLTGSKVKIHAVCVCDNAEYFYNFVDDHFKKLGLTETNGLPINVKDVVDIIDGHKGRGYALSTSEELKLLTEISSQTGLILDRVYTLKAVKGMLTELQQNPSRFKGKRVLFLHTGGIHSVFDGKLDEIMKSTDVTNKIYNLDDFINDL